jgi:hypothetical protein
MVNGRVKKEFPITLSLPSPLMGEGTIRQPCSKTSGKIDILFKCNTYFQTIRTSANR